MILATRTTAAVLFLALVLSPYSLFAKGVGRIHGKVTGVSGDGLIGAIITLFRQDQNGGTISFTRSDRSGNYVLANLSVGSYYLQVSRDGFQPLTSSDIKIESGKSTAINLVLQQVLDIFSAEPDPRNWGLGTVLRSTYDRRMILRSLPGDLPVLKEPENSFHRAGALTVTSGAGLGDESYAIFPASGESGVTSNFAFVEPVSDNARLIFAGQVNRGYDSWWRVRNTYHVRPDASRDFKLSLGYGQLTLNGPASGSMGRPTRFLAADPANTERGVRMLALGMEARNSFLDAMDLEYGFDVSRIQYGHARTFLSPFVQVVVTPVPGWLFRSALATRRLSDSSLLSISEGDTISLADPTYIARLDGSVRLSQFRHAELAAARTLSGGTALEVALYEDRMQGPGLPFMVATTSFRTQPLRLVQPREDQARQRGMRLSVNGRILDAIRGSIAYVYGTGSSLVNLDENLPQAILAEQLLNHMQRSYYHALTGQIFARIPRSQTLITTVIHWYPGYTLTPIDLFGDRTDILTKGVNFSIRQPIPLPEFLGSPGRWEALVDVRNFFDNGRAALPARDGKLVLYRNPRTVRFGINLNLY